jgi:hypothetical protein
MSNCRDASKQNYSCCGNIDQINMGSLQRIADAIEVMARDYQKFINDRDRYLSYYKDCHRRYERQVRSNSALRGFITKLKNRLNAEPAKRSANNRKPALKRGLTRRRAAVR